MKRTERIALVTGANKGIGFEVARQLARRNFHVFIGARNETAGQQAAERLRTEGAKEDYGEITFLNIDVSRADSIRRAAEEFSRVSDRLDTLVNNAGILLDDDKDVLTIMPEMRIVNVSSTGGQLADGADGWAPAYCISKTALSGVTVQLAAALPKFAVNSVCPGWVRTDMGGSNATRSVLEGAAGIVWLAADAPQSETGKFWRDRKVIPW